MELLAELGLTPVVAIEYEFYLIDQAAALIAAGLDEAAESGEPASLQSRAIRRAISPS